LPETLPPGVRIDAQRAFRSLRIAVLTVSDTRTAATDTSGDYLASQIAEAGHSLLARTIARDDIAAIRAAVRGFIAAGAEVVLTTGGTGLTGRDVTPEALEPLFTKRMDGFSVTFHIVSFQAIGLSTLQSRATAGLIGSVAVFCLPGSPSACRDGWSQIIRWQLDNRARPCNLAELMPRFSE
jgi:molybdenum cofactor biosynthesis protein B